jgi:hypothetical protein
VKKRADPGEHESKMMIPHLADWSGNSAIRGFTVASPSGPRAYCGSPLPDKICAAPAMPRRKA